MKKLQAADESNVMADSAEKLQLLMSTLNRTYRTHGMEINTKKKVMATGEWRHNQSKGCLQISRDKTEEGRCTKEIKRREITQL